MRRKCSDLHWIIFVSIVLISSNNVMSTVHSGLPYDNYLTMNSTLVRSYVDSEVQNQAYSYCMSLPFPIRFLKCRSDDRTWLSAKEIEHTSTANVPKKKKKKGSTSFINTCLLFTWLSYLHKRRRFNCYGRTHVKSINQPYKNTLRTYLKREKKKHS